MRASYHVALQPHPQGAASPVRAIAIELAWTAEGGLDLSFTLQGELDRLCVPAPRRPAAADGLWAHTCFEAFLGVAGHRAYRQFNFSPSGECAIYDFDDYRVRSASVTPSPAPAIVLRHDGDRLTLGATIRATTIPAGAPLELALSAVVEAADGTLSYWALHHPGARPDFHHRDAFTLTLARP